jgi:CPA2 family monovalent cation:H+ antiporter-2
VVLGKLVVWTLLVRLFQETWQSALLVAVSLTQIGEFAFLLARAGMNAGHVGPEVFNAVLATALVTILLNAFLVRKAPGWITRRERKLLDERQRAAPAPPGLADHVILCGFGPIGGAVGEALETFKIPFLVVETDTEIHRGLSDRGVPSLFGDARQERILEVAGIERAAALVVTLPETDARQGIVQTARRLRPDLPILTRASSPEEQARLLAAGASQVIQPRLEGAAALIQGTLERLRLAGPRADAYLDRFREAMGLPVRQCPPGPDVLPELREVALGSGELADHSLREARVRERFGVLVLAVSRADGPLLVNPSPDTLLHPGDRVRVFGLPEQIERFEAAGRNPESGGGTAHGRPT